MTSKVTHMQQIRSANLATAMLLVQKVELYIA